MRILSLFDGISCAQVALGKVGISIDKYYASEIDKYAIQITQKNHPDTIQVGDVCQVKASDFSDIDLIIGGSPCTNLSRAGDKCGVEGKESKLFFEFVRLLKEINPKYFILENVASMYDTEKNIMSSFVGTEPIMIDAGIISAQTRRRYFWTNYYVEQPEPKNFVLSDVLEDRSLSTDITERMNLKKEGTLAYKNAWNFVRTPEQKARTLMVGGQNISNTGATNVLVDDRYYKLSPIECERLTGVIDNYTKDTGISDTQKYRMLGNAFHVDVVAHILEEIIKEIPCSYQTKLF